MAAFVLAGCTGNTQPSVAAPTVLTCQDSAGHGQKDSGARWVGGVGSPGLYGGFSGDNIPKRSKDGHRYLTYKDPVAVSPRARPYRTITVISPRSARLLFAGPKRWAAFSGAVLPVLSRSVRLSACGRDYAWYFGAILVRRWTCVTLAVAGPERRLATFTVPVMSAQC